MQENLNPNHKLNLIILNLLCLYKFKLIKIFISNKDLDNSIISKIHITLNNLIILCKIFNSFQINSRHFIIRDFRHNHNILNIPNILNQLNIPNILNQLNILQINLICINLLNKFKRKKKSKKPNKN